MSEQAIYIHAVKKSIERVLRLVRKENGGPRTKNVLAALVGESVIDMLIADGMLVMYGERRGATYGLPKGKKR